MPDDRVIQPIVPESFRERPYARQHYAAIARWAAGHHPFYRRRCAGAAPEFPVLSRREVMEENELLLNGFPETGRTSGSIAMPVRVSWSAERTRMDHEDNRHHVEWMGGQLPDIRILSLVSHSANERTIDILTPVEGQLEFIFKRRREAVASALVTYPSNLVAICQHALEHGLDLSFMKRIVCLSEVYEPWMEELAAQVFPNAARSATYSSVEFGLIALRCPHRPENYHIAAHKLGVEILDGEGRPCREGEAGQVVVTDYWNRRSTLIRYALGDIAAPATCGCGKINTPAMTAVAGRVRDTLKDARGRPVQFAGLSSMFRDSPEIRQFQVVQPAIGHFRVRYVARGDAPPGKFFERVRQTFDQAFGGSPRIDFERCDEIERAAGGKFHISICLA
jgi:phenylacetate-coenzyme A ligase PaaK-like adenylate-forming protein